MFDFDDFAMEDLVTRSINPKDQQDSTILHQKTWLLGVTKFHGSLPLLSGFRCSLLHRTSLGHKDGSFFGHGTGKRKGLQSTPRQKSEKIVKNI